MKWVEVEGIGIMDVKHICYRFHGKNPSPLGTGLSAPDPGQSINLRKIFDTQAFMALIHICNPLGGGRSHL